MTEKKKTQAGPLKVSVGYEEWKQGFMELFEFAKANAPQNNGMSVKFCHLGTEGTIVYDAPTIRYSRGGSNYRNQKKKKYATEEDVLAIVSEYPDALVHHKYVKGWYIEATRYPFSDWQKVMNKVNAFEGGDWRNVESLDKKLWVLPQEA